MNHSKAIISFFDETLEIIANEHVVTDIFCIAKQPLTMGTALANLAAIQLLEYQQGVRKQFSFPYQITGSEFRVKVYQALLKVGFGETIAYQQLAQRINQPQAQQAIGQALGKNRLLIAIPCHRIIKKDHSIGGFSSPLTLKKALLEHEQKYR